MQETKVKVFNVFNAPKGAPVPHGDHIYKWEYLDDNGELQTQEENIHDKIQSYLPRVDYKKQIERGELELNGSSDNTIIKDYTRVPDNTVDTILFLRNLAAMDKEQVTNLMEQVNKTSKINVQKQQAANQTSNSGGAADRKIDENQSKNSTVSSNSDAGGQQ